MYKRAIFVFGSNTAGRHGKGAALHAHEQWGAKYGVGEGLTGNAYALPTKTQIHGRRLVPLLPEDIDHNVKEFIKFARRHPEFLFLFTPVGCGLAGQEAMTLWNNMRRWDVPTNVVFTSSWLEHKAH